MIENLGITGRKLQFSTKTKTGKKLEDTLIIDGLIVSRIDFKTNKTNELKHHLTETLSTETSRANCKKALEPLEIISCRNGGPYAKRTKFD